MRLRVATALAGTLLGGLALFSAAALAATGTYKSGPLTATFSASGTRPNCKQLWPVTITARYNGRPTNATAYYQFLYRGQVVSTVQVFGGTKKNPHSHLYHFYSKVYDNTFGPFGSLSVGYKIDVRAVVQVGRYKAYPGLYVTVTSTRGCPAK
jgi:hypothetical protein